MSVMHFMMFLFVNHIFRKSLYYIFRRKAYLTLYIHCFRGLLSGVDTVFESNKVLKSTCEAIRHDNMRHLDFS